MSGNIPIGTLLAKIDADISGFSAKLDTVIEQSGHAAHAAEGIFGIEAIRAAIEFGQKVLEVVGELTHLAAEAENVEHRMTATFGSMATAVDDFAKSFAHAAGLDAESAKSLIANFGAMAEGMGFNQKAAAALSEQATQLAGDLAAFRGVPVPEVLNAIQMALLGSTRSMRQFGVALHEADVTQRALEISGKRSKDMLTEQERAVASLQIISEKLVVTHGALADRQDSLDIKSRQVKAAFTELHQEIAKSLAPDLLDFQKDLLLIEQNGGGFLEWLKKAAKGVDDLGNGFAAAGYAMRESVLHGRNLTADQAMSELLARSQPKGLDNSTLGSRESAAMFQGYKMAPAVAGVTATKDLDAVKTVMMDLNTQLAAADELQKRLGPEFDSATGRATAYGKAIQKLTELGVPLNDTLDNQFTTLGDLTLAYGKLPIPAAKAMDDLRKGMAGVNLSETLLGDDAGKLENQIGLLKQEMDLLQNTIHALTDAGFGFDSFIGDSEIKVKDYAAALKGVKDEMALLQLGLDAANEAKKISDSLQGVLNSQGIRDAAAQAKLWGERIGHVLASGIVNAMRTGMKNVGDVLKQIFFSALEELIASGLATAFTKFFKGLLGGGGGGKLGAIASLVSSAVKVASIVAAPATGGASIGAGIGSQLFFGGLGGITGAPPSLGANAVSAAGGQSPGVSISFDLSSLPAPKTPFDIARDGEWHRVLAETIRSMNDNGARLSIARA